MIDSLKEYKSREKDSNSNLFTVMDLFVNYCHFFDIAFTSLSIGFILGG